ncbi:MAG: hypothetical protein ACP5IJ_02795 [Candidatus Nanoarchaeia archaeon]
MAEPLIAPLQPQPETKIPEVKKSPEFQQFQTKLSEELSSMGARLRLVEQKIEGLRGHVQLLDNTLMEKHKSLVSEIRDIQDNLRALRADIDGQKDLIDRLAKRMEALASAEEVKVLQRYVELWQPLQFVTRAEVKTLVQNALKAAGIHIKEEG